ncbi:alcohol dehydrogenase catalytic domain-containing protein [Actinoplanes sp. KI2]|uniref:alcohol dehydrogenase catalytic domain-containing protein n=1 Tax=Actinoplanes sp. KI2 TaxID=2983315 RepID=UPI0021D57F8B|nr:alcohol dehydrogenase catalytic domain-containing protein [Actinoplanes sp. KI2]MCU7728977.1 alcohol dehydrogenase catalytic domain-containing protein [Actinoplanes sp. KI2]
MRALVYDAIGGPISLKEIKNPDCPDGGAVVEVRATGVCRSDWHAWRGHDPVPLPHVPGHEFAGVVVESDSARFAVGDRVTAPFVNGCGACDYCRSGNAQVCPDQTQPGFTQHGSFAERVVVRAADTNLVHLPDEIDFVGAAALGCRFATAFRALRGGPWETVAVFGCGGVGLSVVMIAVAMGARVIAVDPSPAARAAAVDLGAVVQDPVDVDIAIDAYGSAETALASVRSLRRGGRHVQVGLMLGQDAHAPLPWDLVVARELTVVGSHGMAAADYPPMIDLVASGRLDPRRLVREIVPLAAAGAALTAMDDPIARAGGIVVAINEYSGGRVGPDDAV